MILRTTARVLAFTVFAAFVGFSSTARAEVKLHTLFSDGMVLQQGVEVPVWGTANEGEKVTVTLQGQTVRTTAKHGRWIVHLKRLKAGGPFEMTVTGDNQLVVRNVLVGEVWLASGQSNMAFLLPRASNGAAAMANARDSQLRYFKVPHESVDQPQTTVDARWMECTPDTVTNLSAVAYFFARDLRAALNVPVGLLEASVGGTPAEAWVSRETLEKDPELKKILERYAQAIKEFDAKPKKAPAKKSKKPATPTVDTDPRKTAKRPNGLYNAMIAPLQPYAIAGAIWYQGEANSGRAAEYQKLFPALIRNWREAFDCGEFPFLFVQIAPHERMSPEIREAQMLTMQNVPRTAMAVITDHGEAKDIHPKEKEPVGQRLALAARALAYGHNIEYSGPLYKSMKVKGDRIVLSFTHVGRGLTARGGELKGFQIAGKDGKFVDASASIEGDKVIVINPAVSKPVAVRYGWATVPDVNLFNADGLPASPFRTDRR